MSGYYSVEVLNNNQGNCQIRYFHDKTCLLISVFGPISVQTQRASKEGIIEVQIKMDSYNDYSQQKSLEQKMKALFEKVLNLEEYVQNLFRIVVIVEERQEKEEIQVPIINGIQLILLLQGVQLKETIYAQSLQEIEQKINGFIVINASSNSLITIEQENYLHNDQLKKLYQQTIFLGGQFKNWLRQFLYDQMIKKGAL